MKTRPKKSMNLENLAAYVEDLLKMGFVSQYVDEKGNQKYKLTKLGEKSGLKDFQI